MIGLTFIMSRNKPHIPMEAVFNVCISQQDLVVKEMVHNRDGNVNDIKDPLPLNSSKKRFSASTI